MKRYILLSAGGMLFFGIMNFGMLQEANMPRIHQHFILNQVTGVIDRDQKTLKESSQQIIVYESNALLKMVNLYLQNHNKSQSQNRICKFKHDKFLKKIKKLKNIDDNVSVIKERKCFGFIAEEVESPKEKELKRIVNGLYNHSGRVPTDTDVRTERERELFVNKCKELEDDNPDIMESWKQINDSLLKVSLGYTEELKKQQQAIEKYQKEYPDLFK